MAVDFDGLTPEQKIEQLRAALAEFAKGQKLQGDQITVLGARYNVLKAAFGVIVQKLARSSGNPERFVMDIEKLMEIVGNQLASRESGAVIEAYKAEIKEMFATLRKTVDPTGSKIKKPH